ncbi:MAG TPA: pyridoxal phosphate-dependent aminotransferase [Acidimicrobiales bacterium]|nr:pyridoxal phosphate-dependent aminotransferase [Acidimicrobiales bacterium]
MTERWEPPPYPYDRLAPLREKAAALPGGVVDLSIGDPTDPPPDAVVAALATSGAERSYPTSVGSPEFRAAASAWLASRLGADVPPSLVGACVGTKEFVAGAPGWLRLREPGRDTVLFPAVSYPTYAMGALLAGCRAVAVPVDACGRISLDDIAAADAARALCLWVNSPSNPAGGVSDLAAAAAWGRAHGVPVLSDECYVEFTWEGEAQTILSSGLDGVLALHSLSKRSNLAGVRSGFYAGDPDLMAFLLEVRKHAGLMTPGPVLAAATVALRDQGHVEQQRRRYWERLVRLREVLALVGVDAPLPAGGFYLWVPAPDGDDWGLVERLATQGGLLASPGEFYGDAGRGHVRVAAVAPLDRLELVASRLAA